MALLLLVPYFTPADPRRRREVEETLQANLQLPEPRQLLLLVDDGQPPPISPTGRPAEVIPLTRRPTLADALHQARRRSQPGDLVLIANSDIAFSESIAGDLERELPEDAPALLCITRHNRLPSGALALQRPPQCSQDAWALRADQLAQLSPEHLGDCAVPFGVFRCDNVIPFRFHCRGWQLLNPALRIQAIHNHLSGVRQYTSHCTRLLGGGCYVHCNPQPRQPSDLEMVVSSLSPQPVERIGINRHLELVQEPGPSPAPDH
ncbi:hypothetical protein EVJ50_09435 [Synechococcus sp. RSCCF101]|uniref:hypothetical protein n=1 Tax=Synechococcus sp. RSCCF101 TaxID=2511069 RepID=UPI001243C256|nr:hypothetical protein [Synechococcus sp. RSCCF101]QEY32403.1 hypothetical protein EVJ50_09435 [Synechococcus sp. RSCCF101]